jgi:hypothetical protein
VTVKEELLELRDRWREQGTPRDAGKQIMRVLSRHIAGDVLERKKHSTPNEGDWCSRCGLPRGGHKGTTCPGSFGRERE